MMFNMSTVCCVAATLTLKQKVSRCFCSVGQRRQLVTWQLECYPVQECTGHYMLLMLHLPHSKHDWINCSMSWSGSLSDHWGPEKNPVVHLQSAGWMTTASVFFCPKLLMMFILSRVKCIHMSKLHCVAWREKEKKPSHLGQIRI